MRPDLAALVGSRICHDLISPIGAISNGVELLSLAGSETGAEMDLIKQSVDNATARIRFFRVAYGASEGKRMMTSNEVSSILAAYSSGVRVTFDWQLESDQTRAMIKCAFLLLQALEAALPLGGVVTARNDGGEWRFVAKGQRLSVDHAVWSTLSDGDIADTPEKASQVQFALLPEALETTGQSLSFEETEDSFEITLTV